MALGLWLRTLGGRKCKQAANRALEESFWVKIAKYLGEPVACGPIYRGVVKPTGSAV